jgi:hypothetical protein
MYQKILILVKIGQHKFLHALVMAGFPGYNGVYGNYDYQNCSAFTIHLDVMVIW